MLSIYRRHRLGCKFADDRISRKCRCSLWATGTLLGQPYRRSLKTRSFERAQQILRNIEDGTQPQKTLSITIKDALTAFIADCESRNLNPSTLAKHRRLRERILAFSERHQLTKVADIDVALCRNFRDGWTLAPRTASKELERLKSFFRFCVENSWIASSPATSIKAPEVKPNPTLPLSDAGVVKIFAHADFRCQLFFRVLLHSGLRVIDAAQLRPEKIIDGKLFLCTQKTGVPDRCPLPTDLLQDLEKIPLVGGYYFAVTSSNPVSIAEYYRVKLAKIDKKFRPHRFRDTFAINLLLKGVSIENVAILLGNTVSVCEKHYSPWVLARQSALEKAVESTWGTSKLVRVK